MHEEALNPLLIAGLASLVALVTILAIAFCWWVTRLVREHNAAIKAAAEARGAGASDFLWELGQGKPEALEKVQKEIGH